MLAGLAGEPRYANDELIDDQLRSAAPAITGPAAVEPGVIVVLLVRVASRNG